MELPQLDLKTFQQLKQKLDTEANSCMIRPPEQTLDSIPRLVKQLYPQFAHQTITKVSKLDSYDDRNFYIRFSDEQEFVLKITNSLDTGIDGLLEGQNEMLLHLSKRYSDKFRIPVPIMNSANCHISRQSLDEKNTTVQFAIRLLQFVPGRRLCEVTLTRDLLLQCGKYLATLNLAINDGHYHSEAIQTKNFLWSMKNVPLLRMYVQILAEDWRRQLVIQAVEKFEHSILSRLDQFEQCYIHGDFNEQNILVTKVEPDSDTYTVNGVIDFGDIYHAPRLFDLAILIAYAMLVCAANKNECQQQNEQDNIDPILDAPALLLKGYQQVIQLSQHEIDVLMICAQARLAQSVTLGVYTYGCYPENSYLLATTKYGWSLLKRLANQCPVLFPK